MLNVIMDLSGSMCEQGKLGILKNLLRYIMMQAHIEDVEVSYFGWKDVLKPLDAMMSTELSELEISGSLDWEVLYTFLNEFDERDTAIVLTDGDRRIRWQKTVWNERVDLYVIAIGADVDGRQMTKAFQGIRLFRPEDISYVFDASLTHRQKG